MDIKFIAKRPKQKSWYENCADLMAFRIQLGNFDVASAHVVPNSKGRSINSCSNTTPLKTLQEWVIKLRGHYHESTKFVEINDELTHEQKMKLDSVGFTWSAPWASGEELFTKESCLVKQQEKTDFTPADGSIGIATIKSNLFGMTLEQTVC